MLTYASSSSSSSEGLNIVIVGAGIAGLAAARTLRERHKVTVIEQWDMKNEIGAAIHLGPNASRLILGWGVDLSESPHFRVVREYSRNGTLHFEKAMDPEADWGSPWLLNHRVTLHRQLFLNAICSDGTVPGRSPRIVLGRKVISADASKTTVTLDDGTVLAADVVIGADGIRSVIQSAVLDNQLVAKSSGHSAYRCLIPGDSVKADPEWAYLFDTSGLSIFVAEDRRVVAYTCRFQGQDFLNIVAPCPDKSLASGVASKESWSEKGTVEELVQAFKDFSPSIQRMLSYSKDIGLWQLRDQDPLPKWHKNCTVLIGDASHPMLPHLGQGGSQAIEDADVLAWLFRDMDHSSSREEISDRLQTFFDLRWERATFCQENSREQALGRRAEENTIGVPLLNPLKTSQYLFSYKGAAAQDEEQNANSSVKKAAESFVTLTVDALAPASSGPVAAA